MPVTPELLHRYYQGNCTDEEKQLVRRWLESQHWEDIAAGAETLEEKELKNKGWQALEPQLTTPIRRTFWWKIGPIAALLLLLLGYFYLSNPAGQFKTSIAQNKKVTPAPITYQILTAQRGEQKTFFLSDGTQVLLNAESELRIPSKFEGTNRQVILSGEGYFKVAKDPAHPFIIQTSMSRVKVLGTVFNLKAYPGERVRVSVEEGKVQFSSVKKDLDPLILTAQQQACLSRTLQRERFQRPAWWETKLAFEDTPLGEIIPVLERKFDVRIELSKPELASLTFKGAYAQPSLPVILDDLSYVLKFHYKLQNRSVTIY